MGKERQKNAAALKLHWRDHLYDFNVQKIWGFGHAEPVTRNSDVNCLIFGADTEQVKVYENDELRWESQCFQLATPWSNEIVYVGARDYVLKSIIEHILDMDRTDWKTNKVIIYIHNLGYDLEQMIKFDWEMFVIYCTGLIPPDGHYMFEYDDWTVTLDKVGQLKGTAVNLNISLKRGKEKLTIKFRDSTSFFPTSLKKLLEMLNLGIEKMDRQENLGEIDYRDPNVNPEEKAYFEEYSLIDSEGVRLAGEMIRDLHIDAGLSKIRVSAPGYAIAALQATMEKNEYMITGVRDQRAMQLILDTYRGGRTGGIEHGIVHDIDVADFHSSYPAAMTSLPSFSQHTAYEWVDVRSHSLHQLIEYIHDYPNCFLRIDGVESDNKYPSLITTHDYALTPIYGDFENIATTGYEVSGGIRSGTLKVTKVHMMLIVDDDYNDLPKPWKTFSLSSYDNKRNQEKGSIKYNAAKLGLNAPYGKTIESNESSLSGVDPSLSGFYTHPDHEKEDAEWYYKMHMHYALQGKRLTDDDVYDDVQDLILAKYGFDDTATDDEIKEVMDYVPLSELSIDDRSFGRFAIPAAASFITAIGRIRLRSLIKCTDALYWDTDSAFFKHLPDSELQERLSVGTTWLPDGVVPLVIGEELGELDLEIKHASGVLAGTKRYFLEADGKVKSATHGMPALHFDMQREILSDLATGYDSHYTSKEKPMKISETQKPELLGVFKSKVFKPKFKLDERLDWREHNKGWTGTVKSFKKLLQITYDDDIV